jgi:D-alanyl-D-alanine carboxypeptidase/D-alanyl-D-alanine-endopeptidase (penicillin-binding protein 4)
LGAGAVFVVLGWIGCGSVLAQHLPDAVEKELKRVKIPPRAVGIYVQSLNRLGKTGISVIALNESIPLIPASAMKVVTTYSALSLLGPAYRWKTRVYTQGQINDGILTGNLHIKGSGDPRLNLESLWSLLRDVRSRGVRDIRGNLVLDRGAFENVVFDPARFDGEPFKPYNAGPDALLLNHKVLNVRFMPNPLQRNVQVSLSPLLDGVSVIPPVLADEGPCHSEWMRDIQLQISDKQVRFEGEYPLSCGEKTWYIYPHSMSDSGFFRAVFVTIWKELGGTISGSVLSGTTPSSATLLTEWQSPALAEVVRDVNKYSNNVMARHLLLGIAAQSSSKAASVSQGAFAIRAFLASRRIALKGLQIENGSGLSRTERISALTMGKMLADAYYSPVMPEFMASLPVAGVDGTLTRQLKHSALAGRAHLKTGAIQDVRAVAGYVLAASGERYVVVFMVNHPNAGSAKKARDALLGWVYSKG